MDDKLIFRTGMRLLALGAGFLITRFPLFSWIGSYDWLRVMVLLSGATVCLFSLTGRELTANVVPLSFAVTYIAAHYLSTDGQDPGGARTNNAWLLWTAFHIAVMAATYLIDRMFHVKHKGAGNE